MRTGPLNRVDDETDEEPDRQDCDWWMCRKFACSPRRDKLTGWNSTGLEGVSDFRRKLQVVNGPWIVRDEAGPLDQERTAKFECQAESAQ